MWPKFIECICVWERHSVLFWETHKGLFSVYSICHWRPGDSERRRESGRVIMYLNKGFVKSIANGLELKKELYPPNPWPKSLPLFNPPCPKNFSSSVSITAELLHMYLWGLLAMLKSWPLRFPVRKGQNGCFYSNGQFYSLLRRMKQKKPSPTYILHLK